MDSNAEDVETLSWHTQILVDIADTLLVSPDITQALAQAQTDPSVLREIVISNADDLMSSDVTPVVTFVDRIGWELFLPNRLVRYGVPAVVLFLLISLAAVVTPNPLSLDPPPKF
jgi:hypothetical protein